MGSYSDKLKRKDYNLPRRGSYKPPERKKRQRRPVSIEKNRPINAERNRSEIRSSVGADAGSQSRITDRIVPDADTGTGGVYMTEASVTDVSDLQFSRSRRGRSSPRSRRAAQLKVCAPAVAASAKLHHEIESRNEDQNSGVSAANAGITISENVVSQVPASDHHYGRKLKNNTDRSVYSVEESITGNPGEKLSFSDGNTEGTQITTSAGSHRKGATEEKTRGISSARRHAGNSENTGLNESNPLSRFRQRQEMKQRYAAAARGETTSGAAGGISSVRSLTDRLKDMTAGFGESVKNHAHLLVIAGVVGILLAAIMGGASSCSMMIGGSGNGVVATSYTAEDEDILGVEEDYKVLEDGLREELSKVESELPDYDEYVYHISEIGHNPYELATLLTILFEDYKRSDLAVQEMLLLIFDAQYELTYEPATEIRTREVERTGTREVLNEETGEIEEEEYTYTDTEEYEYRIMTVTMINHQLRKVIDEMELPEDQMERFEIILALRGNRSYLFGDDIYANVDADAEGTPQNPYLDYRVPGEALTDQEFARMYQEAKKYLGQAYVWGGSNPTDGFDCSGYVCWVINASGVGHIGRTTAEGIRQWTTPISASERKPGDIVYFRGTYDTVGASHVGIYVGDGMMIHCGNPCKFSNIDSGYFANHMLGYGRIPDN